MPEYPRSPFEKTGASITPRIDGDALDATIIGGTTSAPGNFTTLDVSGQVQGDIVNNLNAFDFGERIMELSTDLIFLNALCNDPSGGAGSYVDISTKGYHGTPVGSWTSGDRIRQGRAWVLDPNGTDTYIDLGDNNDFSFGDGTNDSPATWFGMVEVIDNAEQNIISKRDDTSGNEKREWRILLGTTEKIYLSLTDESAGVSCFRSSDIPLSIGKHSFVITYSGLGGATAANEIVIYIDGIEINSSATNNASYVAMENLTTPVWIGAFNGTGGTPVGFIQGDYGCIGIDDAEWSAMTAWRFHQLCLVNYSEDGIGL